MPPQRIDPEIEKLILKLSKGQREIESEDAHFYRKIERAEKIGKFVWFIMAALIAIVAWVIGVQTQLGEIHKEMEARKVTIDRVNEMWFMKEHGIPNNSKP